mgnify:CR=1 FL=1
MALTEDSETAESIGRLVGRPVLDTKRISVRFIVGPSVVVVRIDW